jgi:hypothetical protein
MSPKWFGDVCDTDQAALSLLASELLVAVFYYVHLSPVSLGSSWGRSYTWGCHTYSHTCSHYTAQPCGPHPLGATPAALGLPSYPSAEQAIRWVPLQHSSLRHPADTGRVSKMDALIHLILLPSSPFCCLCHPLPHRTA